MKNIVLLVFMLCLAARTAIADDIPNAQGTRTDEKALIDKFVSDRFHAIRNNDLTAFRAVIHPKSLECLDDVAPKYVQQALLISSNLNLRQNEPLPNWKEVDSSVYHSPQAATNVLSADDLKKKDKAFLDSIPRDKRLPVLPEKSIALFLGDTPKPDDLKSGILIAMSDGRYVEVRPCMSPQEVKIWNDFYDQRYSKK